MKPVKYMLSMMITAVMLTTIGCASNSANDGKSGAKKESAGEYIDDSVITIKVKSALLNEPTLKSFEFKVITYKGIVQLSGFVSSQNSIDQALAIAAGVSGVKSVKNDMQLKAK